MSSMSNSYLPDYLVAPGEVLVDYLESLGMSQVDLALRTGLAKKTINEIVKGKAPITPDTALKFERVLGRPAHFWSRLEVQYQENKARIEEYSRLQLCIEWLKRIPIAMMVKLGWISAFKDKTAQLGEVLNFFGVNSPEQWEAVWNEHQVAYRQTKRFETCPEAVSAWLRKGEIEAQKLQCASFDKKRFQDTLNSIKHLTIQSPKVFQPELVRLCAEVGVAVVFVPELPKTGVCGATRWLGDKAVIQLSLRYRSNDQLWFTFFHEAGHILKHGRKDIFIEGKGLDGEKEDEANAFARDHLIPPAAFRQFLAQWDRSLVAVEKFAENIGIASGIVVGRLQHEGRLHNSCGNKLKVFYTWAKPDAN